MEGTAAPDLELTLDAFTRVFEEALVSGVIAASAHLYAPDYISNLRLAYERGEAESARIWVVADSVEMKAWLDRHWSQVRLLQPFATSTDRMLPGYCTTCEIP